ncbi:uncharacterized protein N7511_004689 [Penicillium nucicola]|uniref:uncharacterized protein n=1 Tax=Penicillium nucicola TaxID=1850975 RepID=UPI002544F017|nr:uncharacterized protein N7511_004689 [Penicillium nucicola]KAJ5767073.1 hypothetical protein N7511_004689 [Penicillium nucicola]
MATIAVILNDCLREFTDLTASGVLAGFDDEVTERRWLDELGRLRVWAANIGAHQTGQSSLDYRLRDASHLKSETTKILQRTLQVLRNLQEVTKEDQHESSEETFSDDNEFEVEVEENELTDIQVLYQSLRNNINLLFQISMAIRKPADHDRLVGMNLKHASFFKPWAQQHISHKFPDAEASTILRLSAAMARQKAVLKYFERHSAKLGKGLLDHDDAESHLLSDTVATEMTLATEMDHLHFLETNSVAGLSQTSYASSIFTGNDSLSIPSAPKESADRTPFECPYCRLVIVVKNTKDWARHVFRDLMPYVCLSHDCITPSKLYESRRQWYRHMCEAHSLSDGHQNLSSCPLCQVNIEPPLSFEKHVGHHLEQLALFILPRTDTEDEQSLNDSPKTASVRGSRDPSVAGISETGVERESSGEIQRKWESPEEFLMRLGKLDEDEFQKTARQARFEVDIIGSAREAAYLPPSSDPGFQDSSASSAPEAERKLKVNEQFLMRSNNLSEDDSDKAVSQSSPQMMAHEQSYVLDPDDHETKRKSGNLSESATAFLRTWFHDHLDDPFPSEMDKQAFVTITGLSIGQVRST